MANTQVADKVPVSDERVKRQSTLHRLLSRPEIGSLVGAIVIYVFFFVVADTFRSIGALETILYASSVIGIVAVAVSLLMIGGEFDLSAGVAVTTASLAAAMVSYELSLNIWSGVVASLALALAIGFLNGYLVMKTGIPSFLITLGTFLMLSGLNLAITKIVTGQVATNNVSDLDGYGLGEAIFASEYSIGGLSIRVTVLWWLLFTAVATWILLRTRVGNWIFAVGGNAASARAVGVPVTKVKVGLFMGVSLMAWFLGMHLLFSFSTVQSGQGVGNEFLYIIAAVIGGTLLTGGYGTAIGAALGAFIFGMTNQGIVYAGWDPDFFQFFLGVMLLLAVVSNTWVRNFTTRK